MMPTRVWLIAHESLRDIQESSVRSVTTRKREESMYLARVRAESKNSPAANLQLACPGQVVRSRPLLLSPDGASARCRSLRPAIHPHSTALVRSSFVNL